LAKRGQPFTFPGHKAPFAFFAPKGKIAANPGQSSCKKKAGGYHA
jgi:hypothetical protein